MTENTVTTRGSLFEPVLVNDLINKVKGRSSLAVLSGQSPMAFNGEKEFTFDMDKEIDIVAENGKKSHGGISLEPIIVRPLKVEYGARVTDEFMYASDEERLSILQAFNEGFANKLAKGLDFMAFHGINPRTGEASEVIGKNNFKDQVTQVVDFNKDDPDLNVEAAVAMVQGSDGVVNGLAMAPSFSAALAQMKINGVKVFPELSWGANPGSVNGLKADVNSTVSFKNDFQAIVGDFQNSFRWGYAKQVPMEVIPYGDPDNSGKDLKGYNQVYIRAEAYLGRGIMLPKSFAIIKAAGSPEA